MKPRIEIVESHQWAMLAWSKLRGQITAAPRLITLDHHTDTSRPFRKALKQLSTHEQEIEFRQRLEIIDYKKSDSVEAALVDLSNDEHIQAAIYCDIISSAFVIAQNAENTNSACYLDHKIACREIPKANWNHILDTSFLQHVVLSFDQILDEFHEAGLLSPPYILDIDLDVFKTFKSISPSTPEFFQELAARAELITIATEPEYVRSCAIDSELTSDYLLQELLRLIK